MRIARIVDKTEAEGPGSRFVIWVQGCPIKCPGCFAQEFQSSDGGTEMAPEDIKNRIEAALNGIEGITILGGEPMAQAAELNGIVEWVRERGLSVMTFTGYVYEELVKSGTEEQKRLLELTDILVDGPYVSAERDLSRPHVGSKNQRFIFLTDRYDMTDIERKPNRVEVRIGRDGTVRINGMGDFPELERMLAPVFDRKREHDKGEKK